MRNFLLVAGARPNFMKVAPILRAASQIPDQVTIKLVHTGQHYDREMSDVFFEELSIPKPDFHLNVGAGTQTEQVAKIMLAFEKVCEQEKPHGVIVVGDVSSTIACALVAKRLGIEVSHVEAGLRSGDMTMPEEINRVLTDAISDHLFVTEKSGLDNLAREGKPPSKVHFVGHVMVDTLLFQREKLDIADKSDWLSPSLKAQYKNYVVATFHRPSNVDSESDLKNIVSALNQISDRLPVIFPVHPRTKANLTKFGISLSPGVKTVKPLSYMDFLNLWKDATVVLTDSGGLQEETTALGVACLTARLSTERPITVDEGTNTLVGTDATKMVMETLKVIDGFGKTGKRPEFWDGMAAQRILKILV